MGVWQIDTEGYDWEVLKILNLEKSKPLLIQFEDGHSLLENIKCMVSHLNYNGYSIYFGGHESDCLAMCIDLLKK